MTDRLLLVSTCGTNLLTNGASTEDRVWLTMISADRCVFLFEGAPELMEIPRLPVRLAVFEELRENAMIFRQSGKRVQLALIRLNTATPAAFPG